MTEKDHYKYGLSGDKVDVEVAERLRAQIRTLAAELAAEKSRLPALGDGYEQLWLRAKTAEDRIRALEAESTDHWEWRRRMGTEAEADHAKISKLEAALLKYGQHQFWHCDSLRVLTDDNGNAIETRLPCTCGFTAVRATAGTACTCDSTLVTDTSNHQPHCPRYVAETSLHLHWCGSHIGRECNCHSSKETATWDCVCGSKGHKRGARCLCGGVYENSAVETKGEQGG